ncbi:hypothetical protein Bca52824_033819 [Brassica carinata]|uniref:Uncharacterized protein n=1 Tax=Brassica carinata TaxID=52824 RepID=A0A8X7SDA4_BRACI|nr:hypothetical protein Bca52824_033819 [Brassica carinata]
MTDNRLLVRQFTMNWYPSKRMYVYSTFDNLIWSVMGWKDVGDALHVTVTKPSQVCLSSVEKETKGTAQSDVLGKSFGSVEDQLEEGEIGGAGEAGKGFVKAPDPVFSDTLGEETPLWMTKHSKNYRRALRPLEVWKVNGAVGTPPKSSKFFLRGNPSMKKCDF